MHPNKRNKIVKTLCKLEGASHCFSTPPINLIHYVTTNWGDAINRPLVRMLSGKRIRSFDPHAEPDANHTENNYLIVGSTIHLANKHTTVWGTGLMGSSNRMRTSPQKILAVRGPKTRAVLAEQNIDAPPIYGDPAIFLPKLYNISALKNNGPIGIVPHYVDADCPIIRQFRKRHNVRVLNIRTRGKKFLRDISHCSAIVSTSLHGIIAAESLGIPACWAEVSNKVLGEGFKFYDYYEGSGRNSCNSLKLTGSEKADFLYNLAQSVPAPQFDYHGLLEACPFKLCKSSTLALSEYLP